MLDKQTKFRCRLSKHALERHLGKFKPHRLGLAVRGTMHTYVKWDDCISYQAYAHSYIEQVEKTDVEESN